MKYVHEFRDPKKAKILFSEIKKLVTQPWNIMEVCGGQTHTLVKYGILDMLPSQVTMIHGPGCPVCVTPTSIIDVVMHLAMQKDIIICSFGDMLRVPGSDKSLLECKSEGADVRILYSPLEAVKIAEQNPTKDVIFFAVGFETTAPANALSVIHAHRKKIQNYSILASHVLVPPAIEAVMSDEKCKIDGFLAAGHVCAIMGEAEYFPLVKKFNVPIVITGFEPLDLLQGILMTLKSLETNSPSLQNQYTRVVKNEGNIEAQKAMYEVFDVTDKMWRGIGVIRNSGLDVKEKYREFNAIKKFGVKIIETKENSECIAGNIMKGLQKPVDCEHFGKKCTPSLPLGAPMVSSEGACAAYFNFSKLAS